MNITEWQNCYPSNWKGIIVPEAMSHPAKYSSKLIRRIYEHMIEQGWVREGDNVLDPFGGVALGALDAMRLGLNWYGVELESKFAGLGNQNIDRWNAQFNGLPRWGTARLFNGDSRHLLDVIGAGVAASVSSPPYADSVNSGTAGIDWEKAGRADRLTTKSVAIQGANGREERYGFTPGQLGAMKAQGFDAAISSPPFAGVLARDVVDAEARRKWAREHGISNAEHVSPVDMERVGARDQEYGTTAGQLGNMPATSFDAAVSSPPYNNRVCAEGNPSDSIHRVFPGDEHGKYMATYPEGNPDQVGNMNSDSFWLAARAIVEQVYIALAPGGHAVWVVKDYVKAKKIVPFCDQWRQLCEAVGFVTLHEHHASLIRNQRTQHTLDGGEVTMQSESKSFFRRLAEKNGSPRIDYETVFCMEKPCLTTTNP